MRVQLTCENSSIPTILLTLSGAPLVIGRSQHADVQIVHPLISRLHCRWQFDGDDVILRDLESTNQTIVNGEPIEEVVVQSGDRVLIGDLPFTVSINADAPATPLPRREFSGTTENQTQRLPVELASTGSAEFE